MARYTCYRDNRGCDIEPVRTAEKVLADAIQEELALGGDPLSAARAGLFALDDDGFIVRRSAVL